MEILEFARGVLLGDSLEAKLASRPAVLSDDSPTPEVCPDRPGRPPELEIVSAGQRRRKIPSITGMPDPAQRRRILHGFANHELQAIELFAWALLKFPNTPPAFRRGLIDILAEEQKHFRLYLGRVEALGGRFGEDPLSGYFWSKAAAITTPGGFCASVGLTFENANLDHAVEYSRAAREAGDRETAAVIDVVHQEEIGHVRFAWHWLEQFKESSQSMTEAYLANVVFPLRPALARGPVFHRESREQAGLGPEFIDLLEQSLRPAALYRFDKRDEQE